jgi:hypothetical protein
MVLKYNRFNTHGIRTILVNNADGSKNEYQFKPLGLVPDNVGEKILQSFKGEFEREENPPPSSAQLCPVCGKEFLNYKALNMHKLNKHKEKKNEVLI